MIKSKNDLLIKIAIIYFLITVVITGSVVFYNIFVSSDVRKFNAEIFSLLRFAYIIDIILSLVLILSSTYYFVKFIVAIISFVATTPIFFATFYLSRIGRDCVNGVDDASDAIFFSYSILTGNGYFQYSVGNGCAWWVITESVLGVIYLALLASLAYACLEK